jgi:hypothetical protein
MKHLVIRWLQNLASLILANHTRFVKESRVALLRSEGGYCGGRQEREYTGNKSASPNRLPDVEGTTGYV